MNFELNNETIESNDTVRVEIERAVKGRGNRNGNPGVHKRAARVNGKQANFKGLRRGVNAKGVAYIEAQVRLAGMKRQESKRFYGADMDAVEREALAWKAEQERKFISKQEEQTPRASMTFAAALNAWRAYRDEKTLTPVKYPEVKAMERFQRHPLLRDLRVEDMKDSKSGNPIVDYFRHRAIEDELEPSTLERQFLFLRKAFRQLGAEFRLTWGTFNPFNDDVRRRLVDQGFIAASNTRKRTYTEPMLAQLRELIGAQWGYTMALAAIEVANINAFRLGELGRMKHSDINEVNGTIRVWRKDSSAEECSDGARRRLCSVPLLPEALAILKAQPRNPNGDDLIFWQVSIARVSDILGEACRELQFNVKGRIDPETNEEEEKLCFHSLRHTSLTRLGRHLFDLQLNEVQLMMISGHKTMRHLQRYLKTDEREAAIVAARLRASNFSVIPSASADVVPLRHVA